MSCEVPHVPLSCNDLRAMGAIMTAYRASLRHGVPPSNQRDDLLPRSKAFVTTCAELSRRKQGRRKNKRVCFRSSLW
jgi:hypothetical protein